VANHQADLIQCRNCGKWFISAVGLARVPRPFICDACRREDDEPPEEPLQLQFVLECV
jgi:hypothetical protein